MIIEAILKINPKAVAKCDNDNIDKITWLEGTKPISKTKIKAKIKELEDTLLRTVAEMDNMRKRSEKERSEAYKIGASIFIKDMLPIIDNLQRALLSATDTEKPETESFVDGTKAILRDFEALLDKTGVKTINPEGEKFDPNFHEAMFEIPTDENEPGTILQVIEQGYILENRLLRAAKVGVSTKKTEEKQN